MRKTSRVNLLEDPIFPAMLRFAMPILFSGLFQQLYNTMDTIIVGHTLGETSLAAIGAAGAIYDLLMGFALGMGNGLSIVTARSFGKKDEKLLKKSVAMAIYIGAALTLSLTTLSRFILYPMLQVLHTPTEIIDEAYSYISVITLFIGCMFAYNLCTGILRAIGNSVTPLLFLIFSSILNMVLDYCFIVYFHMGVKGAAIATALAQGVSVILCLIYIGTKEKLLVPKRMHFRMDKGLLFEMCAQGFSMALMNCVVYAGTAILQRGINGLGYLVIAGHVAARKIQSFLLMLPISMVSAVNTTVSQNYGANNRERVIKALKTGYLFGVLVSAVIAVFFWIMGPALIHLLSGSDEAVVIANGSLYLKVAGPFYLVLAILNCTRTALQAIGSKVLPVISSVIELIGKIIFTLVFIPKFGYLAVIFCEPIIWVLMICELLPAFWKHPYITRRGCPFPSQVELTLTKIARQVCASVDLKKERHNTAERRKSE